MRDQQERVIGEAVGMAVRQARLSLGWSLDDLAIKVSCGKGYLSAIERGLRPPPKAELARRIESVLGLPRGQVERAGSWCRADASVRVSSKVEMAKGLIPLDGRLVSRDGGPWFAVRGASGGGGGSGDGGGAWVVGEPRSGPVGELGWVVVWDRFDGVPTRRDGVSARLDRVWRWAPIVGRLELV